MFRVFPAPAGINQIQDQYFDIYNRVPRASGDKPEILAILALPFWCSPRQRG